MSDVMVYSTPTWPWYSVVKEFLMERVVDFEEVNVAADQKLLLEMVSKSGQMGVPVLDISGEIIAGFDKEKIKQVLGLV